MIRLLPYVLSFFSSFCIMILELVASRLVARHVGASLSVWTSVIGIMLGGICLGNVLGGRLADKVSPSRAIGPLYALGSALTLLTLWLNVGAGSLPGLDRLAWELRTVLVVSIDFLIPGTVLGMIGPVVAKMAVEQSRKSGSAIGDVYFLGAVGSIVGTFVAGFYLIYLAPTSTIVIFVGAAYALLAACLLGGGRATIIGLLAAVFLLVGACLPLFGFKSLPVVSLDAVPINVVTLIGELLALWLAVEGVFALRGDPVEIETVVEILPEEAEPLKVGLGDLAALSFIASLAFMALEMVAGRLVTRHLGSSVFGWTSVIAVLLGGLSIGNFLGGKIADFVKNEKQASWLFLAASILTSLLILAETPPTWLIRNPIQHWAFKKEALPLSGGYGPFLSQAITQEIPTKAWSSRVFFWTAVVFFFPALSMGTVSPVVAKLAIDRVRRSKRTGTAIGQVYAWGMVGSILGTFLTGFLLIDLLGTKGVILALAATMALAATFLGSIVHAIWAGIPLGLCVIALTPAAFLQKQAVSWGLREEPADSKIEKAGLAYVDESNYYYIKINNVPDPDGRKRELVLDNLIHGYFILDHPERLDYDYEHLYALVTHRLAQAKAKAMGLKSQKEAPLSTLFLGAGSYTFPRYLRSQYTDVKADVAEIDPAVTKANLAALGLTKETPIRTFWGDARQFVVKHPNNKYDIVFGDAFNDFSVPWHLTTKEFNDKLSNMLTPEGVFMINIIDVYDSDDHAAESAKAGKKDYPKDPEKAKAKARKLGGFLSAWVETARLTFPNVYVFCTDEVPGGGQRETFVVVVSRKPIDLEDLGSREGDPEFFDNNKLFQPRFFAKNYMDELKVRSRGIILTDDYAPVENLLAPVAETRGRD